MGRFLTTLHASAEGLISRLVEKRAMMKLPISERRRILADQAAKAAPVYEADSEWRDLQGGDIVDHRY